MAVCLLGFCGGAAAEWTEPYTVIEGKGIEGIAFLGDEIDKVQDAWGPAERVVKDDRPSSPVWFHEYRARGALVTTHTSGAILGITLYCKTDKTEPFHETGLMWVNPSSIYETFHGVTSRGLRFRNLLQPEDVYAVYGKPAHRVERKAELLHSLIKNEEPFILDDNAAGFTVYYPVLNMVYTTFDGLVESCHIGGLTPVPERRGD